MSSANGDIAHINMFISFELVVACSRTFFYVFLNEGNATILASHHTLLIVVSRKHLTS
jgi:hypothetical protein